MTSWLTTQVVPATWVISLTCSLLYYSLNLMTTPDHITVLLNR